MQQHFSNGTIVIQDDRGLPYHELHVACAGGLCACGGDLFTEISGGNDLLSQRNTVVLQVNHLEAVTHYGIVVDHLAHTVDELDDQFGHVVTWGSLFNVRDNRYTFSKQWLPANLT